MKNVWILGVLFLGLNSFGQTVTHPESVTILRFLQVTPTIYRSARPDLEGLTSLAKARFKTDLDLEDDEDAINDERPIAEKLGLKFISQPMSAFSEPDDNQVNQTLSILNDPANFPILVHCQHGEDRTGLIIGLYRVLTQGVNANDAYQEMLKNGFHPLLFGLKSYFKQKTGAHFLDSEESI